MSDVAIRAEGLSKKYFIGHETEREPYTALRDVLAGAAKGVFRSAVGLMQGQQLVSCNAVEEFWALKDVSFEVRRAEVVGIIGRNGAGKSTLLKILSRITEPSRGRVQIKGRVASLLEVGTGFHPELTGRENIYLNGAILGMTRAEISRKFDEIVAFAEIDKFLDTPVKRYSSGMYVRLAFAVAAHLEPDILIIDEVLAVGDAEFQKKCLGKMQDVAGVGRTVLFASHNMAAVNQLCSSSVFLNKGQVVAHGATRDIIVRYANTFGPKAFFRGREEDRAELAIGHARAELIERRGKGVVLCLELSILARTAMNACLEIRIKDAIGAPIGFASVGDASYAEALAFVRGHNVLTVEGELGELAEGTYLLSLDLTIPNIHYIQRLEDCFSVNITRSQIAAYTRALKQTAGFGSLCFPARVLSSAQHMSLDRVEYEAPPISP